MTDQEKRELDEFIACEIMGWKFITITPEWIKGIVKEPCDPKYPGVVENNTYIVYPFTETRDSVALMEQRIEEEGLYKEYMDELYLELFGIKYEEEDVTSLGTFFRLRAFRLKTATPLECCIAAKRAWEGKR